jgi:acetyl esterase/lipase/predicted SnoaL-like aldol condensation-catalyzing enzyme
MTQQQREAIAGTLRASSFDPAGDLREQRPLFEKMVTAAPVPADVVTTPGQLGGVPVIRVDIPGTTTDGVILYFHGGFFAIGSAAASVGLASDLARKARMPVVTVDYRLAPEHPYPAAPDDAMSAYRGLLASGQDAARVALAGESAGANLAVVTLAAIARAGLPQPTSAVLMSPWADLAGTGDSIRTKADADPAVTAGAVRVRARDYLGDADPRDPAASPVYARLAGLPPLLIQAGSHEVLLDDAIRLAARAARDDVAVTLDVVPGVPHVFQAFAAVLDEGEAALTRAGAFLRQHIAARDTMTDSAANEAANKALVLKVLTELFEDRDVSALDRYYTDSLIQHNPQVPDGTDELRARVTANPNLHHQTGMVAANGDIVMVHGRYEGLGPKPMVGVDIYRVEDGRVAEHWDVLQEEVSPTSSGHPMFTVPGRG